MDIDNIDNIVERSLRHVMGMMRDVRDPDKLYSLGERIMDNWSDNLQDLRDIPVFKENKVATQRFWDWFIAEVTLTRLSSDILEDLPKEFAATIELERDTEMRLQNKDQSKIDALNAVLPMFFAISLHSTREQTRRKIPKRFGEETDFDAEIAQAQAAVQAKEQEITNTIEQIDQMEERRKKLARNLRPTSDDLRRARQIEQDQSTLRDRIGKLQEEATNLRRVVSNIQRNKRDFESYQTITSQCVMCGEDARYKSETFYCGEECAKEHHHLRED